MALKFLLTAMEKDKALHTELVIEYLIKIRARTIFCENNNLIMTRFIPYIQNIQNVGFWAPKRTGLRFWAQGSIFGLKKLSFVSFVSFVIFFLFYKIQFWRNAENTEYGKKCFPNFAKIRKSEYSAFCRALEKESLTYKHWHDGFSSKEKRSNRDLKNKFKIEVKR